ncbi:hypothetical protein BGZ58_010445 [Dissophora ornata]|nr:hypothetical protein BGZ58_010445 [Dissophora ornata]
MTTVAAVETNHQLASTATPEKPAATKIMDTDKVSAAMGSYMLQGWTMLNDGCPDCSTPLMRNREATSQICVNCELSPPVDPQEDETNPSSQLEAEPTQPLPPPPSIPALTNSRASVLDPMMEARRALRPVGNRNVGVSGPQPPSTPPPSRSSTLPMPTVSSPPTTTGKAMAAPPAGKAPIPRPAGLPPSLPLSPPPPASMPVPQLVPRDMKRSPQNSLVISGSILPPSTPPPPPPTSASGPLPSPPSGPPPSSSPASSAATAAENPEPAQAAPTAEESAAKVDDMEPETDVVAEEAMEDPAVSVEEQQQEVEEEMEQEPAEESSQEPAQEAVDEAVHEGAQEAAQEHAESVLQEPEQQPAQADGDDEDKVVESDDDFEDAEEEVYKPSEEELKERETKREQNERASRLIGLKMLQGWAMLQDPCPNPACHGVPLLRSREKKEYCVVCENYFQREQDLEQGKYTIVSPDNSDITPASASAAASTAPKVISASIPTLPSSMSPFPAVPTTLPPPPPPALSPSIPPQHHHNIHSVTSPSMKSVSSPISSPSMGRNQREILGRVSSSIILPPTTSPNFGAASQQVLGKHLNEELDKLGFEDEEARRHIQIVRKVGEFSNKSLPPVPSGPGSCGSPRPMSTYSNSSDYHPSEGERHEIKPTRNHSISRHGNALGISTHQNAESNAPAPPPAPVSPEVQALLTATNKTIATILIKLEAYRLALEISESPKECQVLTSQIKGLMECLKACRETL